MKLNFYTNFGGEKLFYTTLYSSTFFVKKIPEEKEIIKIEDVP